MTDNWIGVEVAKSMSEVLKVNTTLKSLNLTGKEKKERKEKRKKREKNNE